MIKLKSVRILKNAIKIIGEKVRIEYTRCYGYL